MIHLLAAADMPEPTSYLAMGWIVAGVFGIVGLANQGLALWDRMFPRASPPAHEVFATKVELKVLEEDHEAEMQRIEERFSEWMTMNEKQHSESMKELRNCMDAFRDWQMTIENVLGKVGTKADIALAGRSDKRAR